MISTLVRGIQRAGRLVRQDDLRIVDQRARDGDALLLSAGKLAGMMLVAAGQADRVQRLHGALVRARAGDIGVEQRQFDVLQRAGARQQVELLKHESDLLVADLGQFVAVELADTLMPSSRYVPEVGLSRQPRMFISVDLPDPDGPMMATNSPRSISSEMPFSACTGTSPSCSPSPDP